ncbi:MAG: hypothetical protein ABI040_01820, partial [Rhodoferax sp.]
AVQKHLGGGRLPMVIVTKAMQGMVYDSNPHRLEQDTKTLYDFQRKVGVLKKTLDVHDLFDTEIYDSLK